LRMELTSIRKHRRPLAFFVARWHSLILKRRAENMV
jgi:hypothetical protein